MSDSVVEFIDTIQFCSGAQQYCYEYILIHCLWPMFIGEFSSLVVLEKEKKGMAGSV